MLTNIYPHPTFCDLHQSAFVAESEQETRWFWMQSLDFGQVHFETLLCFSAVLLVLMPDISVSHIAPLSAWMRVALNFPKNKQG